MKKVFFLLLILCLPVAIFLFLKGFGENKFSVTKYYQKTVPARSGCVAPAVPYHIKAFDVFSDSTQMPISFSDFTVLYFYKSHIHPSDMMVNMSRVFETFMDNDRVGIYSIYPQQADTAKKITEDYIQQSVNASTAKWQLVEMERSEYDSLITCALRMDEHESGRADIVLLDKEQSIRGYYQSDQVLETDTLILELRILLKEE